MNQFASARSLILHAVNLPVHWIFIITPVQADTAVRLIGEPLAYLR